MPNIAACSTEARAEMERLGAAQIQLSNELQLSTVLDQLIFVVAVAQQPLVCRSHASASHPEEGSLS